MKRDDGSLADLESRSRDRRRRLVVHHAASFEEAERWDLEYWQAQTPEDRLSALVAIRQDVALAEQARRDAPGSEP